MVGTSGRSDDLARLAVGAGTWSLYLDLATRDPDWVAADADAVSIPEPGLALGLLSGAAMLGWMERRRRPASPTGPRA